jgi:hypothetical protein
MREALKKRLKGRPNDEEVGALFFEMGDDGPRGCVLIASSFIEDVLKGAIEHRFGHLTNSEKKDLFEGTAPLATFSAKIKIAYAMGIIGKLTRHDLEQIRALRNGFAHSTRRLTFDLPGVVSIVLSLNALKDGKGGERFSVQHKCVSAVQVLMHALVGKMHTPVLKVQGRSAGPHHSARQQPRCLLLCRRRLSALPRVPFLQNTVASHTASSAESPTNQRTADCN